MKNARKLTAIGAALLVAALLAGCGATTASAPQAQEPVQEVVPAIPEPAPPAVPVYQLFDAARSVEYTRQLADGVGYRPEGSTAEQQAADFFAVSLSSMGYANVVKQPVPLPDGDTTYDVYVDSPGSNPSEVIVIGAHLDTKAGSGSPGGNDNGSGVGAVLELARVMRTNPHIPTLRFAAFGAEEVLAGFGSNNHHYGSRWFAANLGTMPGTVIGMMSIDMIGVGTDLFLNATLAAPATFVQLFESWTTRMTVPYTFRQDPGSSDHEAFEARGIPSVWLEYRDDPFYHTSQDVAANLDPVLIQQVGHLVQGFIEKTDAAGWQTLAAVAAYR